MVMRERKCPDCGVGLESWESEKGTIWECRTHGVRAWLFEDAFRTPPHFRGNERYAPAIGSVTGTLPEPPTLL